MSGRKDAERDALISVLMAASGVHPDDTSLVLATLLIRQEAEDGSGVALYSAEVAPGQMAFCFTVFPCRCPDPDCPSIPATAALKAWLKTYAPETYEDFAAAERAASAHGN